MAVIASKNRIPAWTSPSDALISRKASKSRRHRDPVLIVVFLSLAV